MKKSLQCKNCHTNFDGSYCPSCGQRSVDLERPIWGLIGEVVRETFELDGRAALTVRALFGRPGKLTREFLDGRRRAYTPPLRLYLVISISFFLLVAWLARSGLLLEPGQDPGFDAALQANFLSEDLPRLMFILLPIFALLMKLAYRHRLYFDHLIFSVHLHSAAYVILMALLPLEFAAGRHIALLLLQVLVFGYFIAYFVLAIRHVYGSTWPGVIGRSVAVLIAYMIVVSMVIENTSSFLIIAD